MAVSGTVLVIGATPVVAGTSGRIVYNNAGAVGELTTTGSGTVAVLATAPTLPSTVTIGAAAGTTGAALFKGTTSGTVTLSVADAAGTWTMKLPTTAGTSGHFLQTDGSGNTTWAAASGGSGITIGTTTITSGTSTRILYNNAGVVGEYTITGSGTIVAMQTSPTFLTTATLQRDSVGATSTDGLVLTNTTAAAAGAQQYSPRLRLTGQGWKTNATAASQAVDWIAEVQPVQGSASPTSNFILSSQVNAGGYSARLTVADTGQIVSGLTSVNAVSYSFAGDTTTGWGYRTTSTLSAICANAERLRISTASCDSLGNDIGASNGGRLALGTSGTFDVFLARGGAGAVLQLGSDVNGAAVSQQLQACNGITGTDKTGGNLTVASGKGTGAGPVSSLIFQTPTVLASGTTAQSLATRLTLNSTTMTSTVQGIFPASTTSLSSLRLPHGSAPTSPVDGDMWTTTAGLYVRINGATVGPLT